MSIKKAMANRFIAVRRGAMRGDGDMEGLMTFQTDDRSRAIRRRGLVAPQAIAILALSLGSANSAAAQHGVCSVGSALTSNSQTCVSQICEADPYCCIDSWDDICISEVKTVCGSDECAPGATVIDAFDGGVQGSQGVAFTGPIWVSWDENAPHESYRHYHKFDLSGVSRPAGSVQLQLEFPVDAWGSRYEVPGEALVLWDVTSDPNTYGFNGTFTRPFSSAVFNDLGGGISYGSRTFFPADEGTLTTIQLNDAGVAAINGARGGLFAIGGRKQREWGTETPVPADFMFLNTGSPETDPRFGLPTVRRLVLVPPKCSNDFDDDGDGSIDYPSDPGCAYAVSAFENPQCQDGLNNDNQAGIDFDGGASLDLDHDGFVDAAFNPATPEVADPDPQCVGKPSRNSEKPSCGLGAELALVLAALEAARRVRRTLPIRFAPP